MFLSCKKEIFVSDFPRVTARTHENNISLPFIKTYCTIQKNMRKDKKNNPSTR